LVIVIVAVLGLLIAGRQFGWLGGGHTPPAGSETPTTTSGETPDTAGNPTPNQPAIPPVRPVPAENPAVNPAPIFPTTAATPNPGALPANGEKLKPGEWEQRLDDILGANEEEAQKATRLLEMFPFLPEDGAVEVAQHLSNLLTDDRYPALQQTLTNAATSEAVLDVLMTDVLNRGNSIKLPTLLQVARTPGHPKAEESRDVLEVFVDENYGTDWAKWEKAIQDWLKENPDEPTEPTEAPAKPAEGLPK
jgi:hypothetical protein